MKNHLYVAIAAGLLLAFACPAFVAAQAAGNSPPAVQSRNISPSPLQVIEKAINDSKREMELADSSIRDQLKILEKKSVSDVAFEDVFRMLHLQKAELMIEVEGLNARLELLKREAEKATSGVKESSSLSFQRQVLERQVDVLKKQINPIRKLHEKGAKSVRDLLEIEQKYVAAELQLSELNARSKKASPGLVEEMFITSLEIAEKKARQKTVQSMLQNYEDSRSGFSKLEDLRRTRSSLESRREELMRELWKIGIQGADF